MLMNLCGIVYAMGRKVPMRRMWEEVAVLSNGSFSLWLTEIVESTELQARRKSTKSSIVSRDGFGRKLAGIDRPPQQAMD